MVDRSSLMSLFELEAEDIAHLGVSAATSEALAELLRRSPRVHAVRRGLLRHQISDDALSAFVLSLLGRMQLGKRFIGDTVLSALCIALERHPSQFARHFLLELSKISAGELPLSPRVASIALNVNESAVASTTQTTFAWGAIDLNLGTVGLQTKPILRRVTASNHYDENKVAA